MTCRLPLAVALAALLATSAAAQDQPGDWTVVAGDPPEQGARDALRPSLWLPAGPATDEGTPLFDPLGRHAAVHFAPTPRAVVVLEGLFSEGRAAPDLDLARATLTPRGGEPTTPLAGDAWRDQASGREETPPTDGVRLVMVRLPFPPLDATCGDVTFSVPVTDGEPLVVRFRRWRDVIADAEVDLAAWKRHIDASRALSAIPPYLDDDGLRRLVARGDPLLSALLLRELARGEAGDSTAVPRFLVLHLLARTEWGRAQGVPDHGSEREAARVLMQWRRAGHPRLPGISPPR